jgi:hypothetical protein
MKSGSTQNIVGSKQNKGSWLIDFLSIGFVSYYVAFD